MAIRDIVRHGFGPGFGEEAGGIRYVVTRGFLAGLAAPAQDSTPANLLALSTKQRSRVYTFRGTHVTGSAFDELRE